MKKKKGKIIILLFLIVGCILVVLGAKAYIGANLEKVSGSNIENVDLSKLKDGTYTGSYSAFPVSAEVQVVINNHSITEIELFKHINGQGSAAEIIPGQVVKAQSLEIDIVSGATYSSKVILKAIEDALVKAY
ncbi:MAG: hypothetical protein K0R80_1915 [Clostridia bacterium]|jgi:uncharacterized protein with FMN-binding domain|nr:hypothetical protein [Clostridia bacterium]MDF2891548.1 hypothetical protein [Clostridia bacterium]